MSLFSYATVDDATFWYVVSWKGLLIAGIVTALGALATVAFLSIQFTSSAARDGFADQRITANEALTETARADVANAHVRIAELTTEAEQLRKDNLVLEEKIAPRRLSGQEADRLTAILSGAKPLEVGIVSRVTDPESQDFASDIAAAVLKSSSGWSAVQIKNWTDTKKGVFIAWASGGKEPPDTSALSKALDAANIPHTTLIIGAPELNRIAPPFEPGFLYVVVGAKP